MHEHSPVHGGPLTRSGSWFLMLFVCVRPPHSSLFHSLVCCRVVAIGLPTITDITDNTLILCDPHLWVWTTRTSRNTRRAGNPTPTYPHASGNIRQLQEARSFKIKNIKHRPCHICEGTNQSCENCQKQQRAAQVIRDAVCDDRDNADAFEGATSDKRWLSFALSGGDDT